MRMMHKKNRVFKLLLLLVTVCTLINSAGIFAYADGADRFMATEAQERMTDIVTALGVMHSDGGYDAALTNDELVYIEQTLIDWQYAYTITKKGEKALYEDLVKVVVSSLGYAETIKNKGSWNEWRDTAARLGILKGVNTDGVTVTRANAANLIYNALEVDMLVMKNTLEYTIEKDTTILSSILKAENDDGIVTETSYTLAVSKEASRYAEIDGSFFLGGDKIPANYLGWRVEYYAKWNESADKMELVWVEKSDKNKFVFAMTDDIEDGSTNEILKATDSLSGKKISEIIPDDIKVIYNGIIIKNLSDYYPDYGNVTLLDNDRDGDYEYIVIDAYELFTAEVVDSDKEIIYDFSNNKKLDLSDADIYEVYKDGEKSGLDDVTKNSILLVAKEYVSFGNENKSIKRAVIYTSDFKIQGTVTELDDEYIFIDNEQFRLSNVSASSFTVGKSGEYMLDYFGRVAYCTDNKIVGTDFGILMRMYLDEESQTAAYIRVYDKNGKFVTYPTGEYVRFSGYIKDGTAEYQERVKITAESLVNMYKNGEIKKHQLVSYTFNSDGSKITSFAVANESGVNSLPGYNDEPFSKDYEGTNVSTKQQFIGMNYRAESSTTIFTIPESGEEDEYGLTTAAQIGERTFDKVECYNTSESKTIGVLVITTKATGAEPAGCYNTSVLVVDRIVKSLNSDDEVVAVIKGVQGGKDVTVTCKDNEVRDAKLTRWKNVSKQYATELSRGDVIQYITDDNGEATALIILYSPEEDKSRAASFIARDNQGHHSSQSTQTGRVTENDGHTLILEGIKDRSILMKDAVITVVEDGDVRTGTPADVEVGDFICTREYRLWIYDIVVYKK